MSHRVPGRKFWAYFFFTMSPFFPANNWLEVAVIGTLSGTLAPLLPWQINHGVLRAAIYMVYNIVGITGYIVLRSDTAALNRRDILDFFLAMTVLVLTGIVPEPWATVLLACAGLFFLRTPLASLYRKVRRAGR